MSATEQLNLFPAEDRSEYFGGRVDQGGTACGSLVGGREPGLSLAHSSTQQDNSDTVTVQNAVGGSYLKFGAWCQINRGRPGPGGKRGECKGFTKSSRKRMADALQMVDRSLVTATFFVTLTVPTDEGNWQDMERWRKAYCERLRRAYGDRVAGFWKKEPHKSGTPHMHFLLLWYGEAPHTTEFRTWNDDAWASVVGSENPHHKERGCRVESIRTWRGASWYLDKYLGKEIGTAGVHTGRIWGKFNEHLLQVKLDENQLRTAIAKRAHRTVLRLNRHKTTKYLFRATSSDKWANVAAPQFSKLRPDETPLQVANWFKSLGCQITRRRIKCGRTHTYPIFCDSFEPGRLTAAGEEKHFFPWSTSYLDYANGQRVLKAARDSFDRDPLTIPLRQRYANRKQTT